mgnify:CR=1 FL=1
MKILKNILSILLLFSFLTCIALSNDDYDSLVLLKSITLEENEEAILTKVTNVSTNSNSTEILISDSEGKILILYDARIGKVLKYFEAPFELSDSLAIKGKYWNEQEEYVRNDKVIFANGKKLEDDYIRKRLRNELYFGIFVNDNEIWASAYAKSLVKPKGIDTLTEFHSTLSTGIMRYDLKINKMIEYICFEKIFEKKYYIFPWPYHFVVAPTRDSIFIITINSSHFRNKGSDSLWIISSYNLKGEIIKPIMKMPEEYTQTKLGYSILFKPKFCFNNKNELLCVFPYAERVFNITNSTFFELKNLKQSNKIFLDSLKENPNLVDSFLVRYFYFLPNSIENVYVTKNNEVIVITFQVFKISQNKTQVYWLIQEYDEQGNLNHQYKVTNLDEHGYIHYIFYDKNKDEFLFFKLLKGKGWFLDFYKGVSKK